MRDSISSLSKKKYKLTSLPSCWSEPFATPPVWWLYSHCIPSASHCRGSLPHLQNQ